MPDLDRGAARHRLHLAAGREGAARATQLAPVVDDDLVAFPDLGVGGFDAEGNSGEENKVEAELKKIWGDKRVRISCTSVRVPVLRGHSLAAWFKTARPCSEAALKKELLRTPGLKFFAKPGDYPTPLENGWRTEVVYAGRLRRAHTAANEFQLWIVSDNLYKGAALNSVQIAERIARL